MADQEAVSFIESEIQKRIKSFDDRRKFYRKRTTQFTLFTAGLSAVTTFLIGVSQIYDSTLLSVFALATSAGITVLSAWDGLYNHRRHWVQNNDTLMHLYELDSDVRYKKSLMNSSLSTQEVEQFYKRYSDILRAANENWKDDRLSNSREK